ncbi:MAG: amidohydrolase [Bacillota bacterium]|nr:MAG: amidohydrolase [Bacillota bacterium]
MKLWTNGFFHSLDEGKIYLKMTTHQGKIVCFDEDCGHRHYDEVIDLEGAHVYPGFVDAHMHLLGYGQKLKRPSLSALKTKDEVLTRLKEAFHHEPLFAEGYRECGITKEDLDMISTSHPIMIRHNDYHSVTANSYVLNHIHLTHTNGVLTEEDATLAMKTWPPYTIKQLEDILETSLKSLYSYGITGAHSDDLSYFIGFKDTLQAFENVLERMPFRAHLLMHYDILDDYLSSGKSFLDQHAYLQLGAIKMFYDGTLSSQTAWMKTTYRSHNHHGLKIQTDQAFLDMVKKCRQHDLPVAIHVIGDQGLVDVCKVLQKYPVKTGLHDRIIHAPWADLEGIELMKKLPIVIDIQPQFLSSDLPWALSFIHETPPFVFPWKTYLKHGLIQAGSSDAPVEIPNPLLGMYASIYRISDHDQKPYFTDESLSIDEAIDIYTKGANYPTYDQKRGSLKIGYIADLTIFDNDLKTFKKHDFLEQKVKMTVINEIIVYKR